MDAGLSARLGACIAVAISIGLAQAAYPLNAVQEKVKRAVSEVATINDQCWAYTLSGTVSNGDSFLAKRDPSRSPLPLWSLEKSFGDEPAATREANFQKGRARDEKALVSSAIDWQSVTLLEQVEGRNVYGYSPVARDNEEENLIENLQGRLYLDAENQQLQRIEWIAIKPFSPRLGVKMERFNLQVNYQKIGPNLLPVASTMEVKAVVLGLKTVSYTHLTLPTIYSV